MKKTSARIYPQPIDNPFIGYVGMFKLRNRVDYMGKFYCALVYGTASSTKWYADNIDNAHQGISVFMEI